MKFGVIYFGNLGFIKFKQGHDCKVLRFYPERHINEYLQYEGNQKPTLQYKFYASELMDKEENRNGPK